MAPTYKGSLTLEWYNKQKSIILKKDDDPSGQNDIPAPKLNWVNKDQALFYEIDEDEGKGVKPYWVDRNDIRVKEARPLVFKNAYVAKEVEEENSSSEKGTKYIVEESDFDDPSIENILIKGDNLLALNTLKKIFDKKPDEEKVKCIYIDPPFTTDNAFQEYDDNLNHSQWLTLFRDRIQLLHSLLAFNGAIFVEIDDNELANCKIILDEVFGYHNLISLITIKRSAPTGHKAINPGPINVCDYLLAYAKNKQLWTYNTLYTKREYDSAYNKFIEPYSDDYTQWEFITINEAMSIYDMDIEQLINKYPRRVIRFAQPNYEGVGTETRELINKSKRNPYTIFKQERNNFPDIYLKNGDRILFYADKLRNIDGELTTSEPLTNFWDDIPFQGIAKEGKVEFKKNKKPEKLIKRVIEMSTEKNDLVLDIFQGSGTTGAVAQKMGRRWIGIETGKHCETMCIPRLKRVIGGVDQTGISKLVKWKGGGSFKYYQLGQSIINIDKLGKGDFNWSLGKKFIEESLLSSYDYCLDANIDLFKNELFPDRELVPTCGFINNNRKLLAAIVSLKEPTENNDLMSYDEIMYIYQKIKKYKSPHAVTIFTNRGIEIAYDSKPDDLEIIKVPHAIFAELEK